MSRRAAMQTDPSFVPSDVGQRIRAVRQQKGLSLAQLGGTELTRGFISAVETGRSSISLKALSYVAERLELPITYFLEGQEDNRTLLPELQLNEAEEALRSQRPTEALTLLTSISEPASLHSRKLWLHGWALNDVGRPREAIPLLQEALTLTETGVDTRQTVLVEYVLANALYAATQYEDSLRHLRQAHARAGELDDQELLGTLTVALGHLYFMQGQVEIALAQYTRARELFGTLSDMGSLAAVFAGLSRIYRQKDELELALQYSRRGRDIWEALHNQRSVARELAQMAARYEELGNTEDALETALEAVSRAQQAGAADVEGLARSSLATVYLRLGQIDSAKKEAEAILHLGLQPEDLGYIDAVIVLAKLASQVGDQPASDQYYTQALDGLERNGFATRYRDVALAYSDVLGERGDMVGALEYARRAAKARASRPA